MDSAPSERELLDEIASDQGEQERPLSLLLTEVREGRKDLRRLGVLVAIGVFAVVFVIVILLAGFQITTTS